MSSLFVCAFGGGDITLASGLVALGKRDQPGGRYQGGVGWRTGCALSWIGKREFFRKLD